MSFAQNRPAPLPPATLPAATSPNARKSARYLSYLFAALVAAAIAVTAFAVAGRADDDRDEERGTYAIGLWGDLPYSDVQALTGVPNLIADMNSHDLAFTAHDGDLKAGNGTPGSVTVTTCADGLYDQGLKYFNSLKAPAVFTPGDNDWTDCDRPSNGGFNSLERLDHERAVFFSKPFTLGQHRLFQEVQTDPLCLGFGGGNVPCVENRRWSLGGVTYATINIQGSCNNLCDTNPDPAEEAARNAADIVWLKQTFDEAKRRNSAAVMLITQADPGFDKSDVTRAPLRDPKTLAETDGQPDGFQSFLVALRDAVVDFQRPVAYVHGDSHYFRIDKPLQNALGQRVENFTRVETYGDNQGNGTNDVNWLKVYVDARSREVFAYQPQVVPANRVAVPAPPPLPERHDQDRDH